jgi:Zn finger protein HypA/HybF involved in hydrogenase expression
MIGKCLLSKNGQVHCAGGILTVMHGMSITQELVDSVCSRAKENQLNTVTKINVDLGSDNHISEDELRFCFQLLCESTIVNNAELEIGAVSGDALTLVSFTGE